MAENLQENNFQNNSQDTSHSKYSIVLYVVLFVIIAGVVFFLYIFYSSKDQQLTQSPDKIFSVEEKLNILEELSQDPADSPSIEEREEILSEISENKPVDTYEYSEESKLQILRSLKFNNN